MQLIVSPYNDKTESHQSIQQTITSVSCVREIKYRGCRMLAVRDAHCACSVRQTGALTDRVACGLEL